TWSAVPSTTTSWNYVAVNASVSYLGGQLTGAAVTTPGTKFLACRSVAYDWLLYWEPSGKDKPASDPNGTPFVTDCIEVYVELDGPRPSK
ncbi:hypothetical protein FRB99_004406, partial [Tulasnella sp. 403]